jgi:hypothetical protein
MVVKGNLLFGPILTLIGGAIMMLSSYVAFTSIAEFEAILESTGFTWADVGFPRELMYLRFMFTLLWGVLAIIGGILAIYDYYIGNYLALIGGILVIVGMTIAIGTITITYSYSISLSGSLGLMDSIFMIIGGMIGLAVNRYPRN